MTLTVLICLSVLFMAAAFVYLAYGDFAGDTLRVRIGTAISRNRGVLIYLGCMLLFAVGLSLSLTFFYETNTLTADMKVVTLFWILAVVTVPDWKKHVIPNKVILAGIALRVGYAAAEFVTLGSGYFAILKSDLISLALAAAIFLLGVLIIRNGIGMGDVKLIMVVGLYQGFTGLIGSLFLSLLVSFFAAIVLLIMKKKTKKDTFAFAPSMLIGTSVAMILTGM